MPQMSVIPSWNDTHADARLRLSELREPLRLHLPAEGEIGAVEVPLYPQPRMSSPA